MQWICTIPVKPFAKQRPRVTRFGTFTPKETLAKEAEVRHALADHEPPMFEGAVRLDITFQFLRPKSAPKSRVYPTVRPDIDNLIKTVCDACNGVLWKDDGQIVSVSAHKRYHEREGIAICVQSEGRNADDQPVV